MNHPSPLTLAEQLAAAQAWWRDAGVDYIFNDEPRGWLTDDTPPPAQPMPPPPPAAPPKPRIGGDPDTWPRDLTSFRTWWLEEPSLDSGGLTPRIAPRGEAGAPLMVIVPMPEDNDDKTLLSGPEGRLIASFVAAMGLDLQATYLAAALPRRTPLPDWEQLRLEGMGEVLLHHVALANPQRLIVLGTRILPLLGHDPAQASPGVSQLTIQGQTIPMLASFAPERLLENARQREGLWRRWLDWTDEATA